MAPKKASAVATSLGFINAAAADDYNLTPLDTAVGLRRHRDRLVYRAGTIAALEQTQEAERVRLEAEQVRQEAEKVRLKKLAEDLGEREQNVLLREVTLQNTIDEWNSFVDRQPTNPFPVRDRRVPECPQVSPFAGNTVVDTACDVPAGTGAVEPTYGASSSSSTGVTPPSYAGLPVSAFAAVALASLVADASESEAEEGPKKKKKRGGKRAH
jgi:hypothetical protein